MFDKALKIDTIHSALNCLGLSQHRNTGDNINVKVSEKFELALAESIREVAHVARKVPCFLQAYFGTFTRELSDDVSVCKSW